MKSKKDFNDCTGFEESDKGESGPVTVSFDKVLHHHAYDYDYDGDPLKSTNRTKSVTEGQVLFRLWRWRTLPSRKPEG